MYIYFWWKNSVDNEGMLNVMVEGNVDFFGYIICGLIIFLLFIERDYSLGNVVFFVVYFDNVVIWYRDELFYIVLWSYIIGK